jgi:hypothetical protein
MWTWKALSQEKKKGGKQKWNEKINKNWEEGYG